MLKKLSSQLSLNALQPRTVQAKLHLAITGLMIISLLGSTLAFVIGTALTQNQLLRQQAQQDSNRITQALSARVRNLESATQLLANDPSVERAVQQTSESALDALNSRAVVLRERFKVGLIQIYNAEGDLRTNLLLSSLYRESSLLDYLGTEDLVIKVINDRVLLLSRAEISNDKGNVIIGIDLETELKNLINQYRLSADMGLRFEVAAAGDKPQPLTIATHEDFPFDARPGQSHGIYSQHIPITLAETSATLILITPTHHIQQVTTTGLIVMIISSVITTALLLRLGMVLTRSIVYPVKKLSTTAKAVAEGDLEQRINLRPRKAQLNIGQDDELSELAVSFNSMVDELQNLYRNLETRVEARTHELATAEEIARTIASSLDLDLVLQLTLRIIRRRLGMFHASIFLVNQQEGYAELREVSGESGAWSRGDRVLLQSNTLVGTAATSHSPCIVPDTASEQRYLQSSWLPKAQSAIALPLLAGKDVIGILEIQAKVPNAFPPEIVNLLNTLTNQIALGIQNAQRYKEEQKRRRFAEVLELTGRVLAGNLDLEELPSRALSTLNALIKYDRASLWIQNGTALTPLAQYGYTDERLLRRKMLSVHGDIYRKLSQERQPMIIDDVKLEANWEQQPWLSGDCSWMGVPITTRGRVIGMVCLTSNKAHAFSLDDAMWVQSFASQAGIALENANLYAEVATMNEQLKQKLSQHQEDLIESVGIFEQNN